METHPLELTLIDVSPLTNSESTYEERQICAEQIDKACRSSGFFRIKGHGVP